jgi:hypothetical protein
VGKALACVDNEEEGRYGILPRILISGIDRHRRRVKISNSTPNKYKYVLNTSKSEQNKRAKSLSF